MSLPLPRGSSIDMASFSPKSGVEVVVDQNGCFYVHTFNKLEVQFRFSVGNSYKTLQPIAEDNKIICGGWTTDITRDFLNNLQSQNLTQIETAQKICDYIQKNKKYHVGYQAHIHRISKEKNYFYNLDLSPVLECYSANTLFVALVRDMGISARLCG